MTPNQVLESKPGMPLSAMVGSVGAAALRFALLMASARRRPEFTYGSTDSVLANIIETCPAIRSVTAGGVPLYGICAMSILRLQLEHFRRQMRAAAVAGRGIEQLARVWLWPSRSVP